MESLLFVRVKSCACLLSSHGERITFLRPGLNISCENDSLIYSFYIQRRTDIHIALYVLATMHKYRPTAARRIPATCELMVYCT